jgi:type I restriction enzyme S subunit
MSWKAYSQYKPSGVEWLGDVPEHWEVLRLRFKSLINPSRTETNGLPEDTMVSFVPMESVSEYGGIRLTETKKIEEVSTGYTYFRDGDVVVAKITPCFENGKGAIARDLENGIGFGTTELHVLRPSNDLDSRFLFYMTMSHPFRNIGTSFMYGAGGQKRIPDDFIRDFRNPIPPLAEQRAIAAFLDRETARIDGLIEKKQRQIELLQEKRAALISHAVTKGLNSQAKMKPSGIEWLGDIPEHWDHSAFRRFIKGVEQGWSPLSEQGPADEDGWAILKVGAVYKGTFRSEEHKSLPSDLEPISKYEVREGDLLLTRGNTPELVADACIVPQVRQKLLISDLHYRVDINEKKCLRAFACYWLISGFGRLQIQSDAHGTSNSMVKVSQAHIKSWLIVVPPISEQKRIVEYLDAACTKHTVLIERIKCSIVHLEEYRSVLISAAVTGKIDVWKEVPR